MYIFSSYRLQSISTRRTQRIRWCCACRGVAHKLQSVRQQPTKKVRTCTVCSAPAHELHLSANKYTEDPLMPSLLLGSSSNAVNQQTSYKEGPHVVPFVALQLINCRYSSQQTSLHRSACTPSVALLLMNYVMICLLRKRSLGQICGHTESNGGSRSGSRRVHGLCRRETGGHLKVMRWLKTQKCVMEPSLYAIAAKHGHLEPLKCMWLAVPELDASVCDRAAMAGHLNIVKWARDNDCRWDQCTFSLAAMGGDMFFLEWLWLNGCPWDQLTCYTLPSPII